MSTYKVQLKNGEHVEIRVYDSLSPDQVYEHQVRHAAYNLITEQTAPSKISREVVTSFLLDLRKRT